jgi:hypothetical protein
MSYVDEIPAGNKPAKPKGWFGKATEPPPSAEPPGHFPHIAIQKLEASGITPEQAEAAGLFWAESAAAGGPGLAAAPALILPYPDPWSGPGRWLTYPRDGREVIFSRARYLPALEPRRGFGKPKKPTRYAQPAASPVMAYLPTAPGVDWVAVADNASIPIVITEGELKALCAAVREYPCIGLGGVSNITRKGGLADARSFLPELERIKWAGRTVYICFDSDRATNPDIVAAEGRLARELGLRRGAVVLRIQLPPALDGSKQGLDDLLAQPDGCDRFESLAESATPMREADAAVAELNEDHAVVLHSGKAVIAKFCRDETLGRDRIDFLTERDLDIALRDRVVADPETGKAAPLTKVWLRHPDRRAYLGGVTFAPAAETAADVLNLWRGFGVEPAPGDWSLLRQHIRDNVCAGVPALFDYVMGWMARLVQRPGEPGEVAIVMRGGRGVGKGKLAQWLGRLVPDHFTHAIRSEDVVGKFNAHLASTVFLFADEAFFAGDPRHEKILNGLITETTIRTEAKFMPQIVTPNCLHLVMATNDAWAIPAATDERRYLVLDVSAARQRDTAYFKAIDAQMGAGGLAAMLLDLLALDISQFEVRRVPQTAALADQKRHTLHARGGTLAWLQDVLEAGEIKQGDGTVLAWTDGGLLISRTDVYDGYVAWEKGHGRSQRLDGREAFGKRLAQALGSTFRAGDNIRLLSRVNRDRPRAYEFGPIEATRKAFAASQGLTCEREDGDE